MLEYFLLKLQNAQRQYCERGCNNRKRYVLELALMC